MHACMYVCCLYSSVLYCETWGNVNKKPLKKRNCATLKYILGVRNQVCNEIPYIGLGLPTLESIILSRQYKFYNNIIKDKDWPLLRYIVNQGRMSECKFIQHYDNLLQSVENGDIITIQSNLGVNGYVNAMKWRMKPTLCYNVRDIFISGNSK